jgi:hypothetical protein
MKPGKREAVSTQSAKPEIPEGESVAHGDKAGKLSPLPAITTA